VGSVLDATSGTFESEEKKGERPLFILKLETNGTYQVQCNQVDRVQGIDGGGIFGHQGGESGTWRLEPQTRQIVLQATNVVHMARWFPHTFKASQEKSDSLEAINPPPKGPQNGQPIWLPLSSPYFHKKVT
jgi:hypothetical protein